MKITKKELNAVLKERSVIDKNIISVLRLMLIEDISIILVDKYNRNAGYISVQTINDKIYYFKYTSDINAPLGQMHTKEESGTVESFKELINYIFSKYKTISLDI